MRSFLVAAVVAVLSTGFAPAGAQPATGDLKIHSEVSVMWASPITAGPNVIGNRGGHFFVARRTGVDIDTGAPIDDVIFYGGHVSDFIFMPCCSGSGYSFPLQTFPSSALQSDPVGNAVRFSATVLDQNGFPRAFDLSFTRPQYLSPRTTNGAVNAYADPDDPQAQVVFRGGLGVDRGGYTVTGTLSGNPFSAVPGCTSPCDWASANVYVGFPYDAPPTVTVR